MTAKKSFGWIGALDLFSHPTVGKYHALCNSLVHLQRLQTSQLIHLTSKGKQEPTCLGIRSSTLVLSLSLISTLTSIPSNSKPPARSNVKLTTDSLKKKDFEPLFFLRMRAKFIRDLMAARSSSTLSRNHSSVQHNYDQSIKWYFDSLSAGEREAVQSSGISFNTSS